MLNSMTGFAALSGDCETAKWDWEIRAVNGKGLDLRLRLPEGCEALEAPLRAASKAIRRGNVTVSLKLSLKQTGAIAEVDPDALEAVLSGLGDIEAAARAKGLALTKTSAAEIAGLPGVMRSAARDRTALPEEIGAQIPALWDAFQAMRAGEGAALGAVLEGQLAEVARLVDAAANSAEARSTRTGDILRARVEALVSASDLADPARLNQELAIIAVKADVTEEIDRLRAHVGAARELLSSGGAVGRKLDFLMQEFNREANTLCSKSGSSDLTAIGLDLKVLIDQMREQVQNLE